MKSSSLFDSVIVRPAAQSDRAAIEHIASDAFAKYIERIGREPEPMTTDYEEIISRGGVVVAIVGGEIVGYVEMYSQEDHLFIDKIAIAPTYQKLGIAHAVYGLIAVTARVRGLRYLKLYTNAAMHENIKLYEEAAGFIVTERRTEHGYDRVYMMRELAE